MTAAIYARKSTEQHGIADEQKSVARQVAHARAFAVRKGWTVDEASVFVDDGISGAEFATRPGFLRLMNALKPRPPFQVLIMSEESRLGREAIETAYALKQLVQAGVRVFFYLEDRERTLDSPTDKIMLSLTAFADELEREKARQRTYDALLRKARAGHVTGGRVFGYDNVCSACRAVIAPGSLRCCKGAHTTRRINDVEAAVVRVIFELCAGGAGFKTIAKTCNDRGLQAPRAQRGRPHSWAPSTVQAVLERDTYRGLVLWNRTRKRNQWGQKHQSDRPASDWLTLPAEELRIVPEALWRAAHDCRAGRKTKAVQWRRDRQTGAPDGRGVRTYYLLTGFSRCASCGGSMMAVSRASSAGRIFRYVCATYWNRGAGACPVGRQLAMPAADTAVRRLLRDEVLRPEVVNRALDLVSEGMARQQHADPARALRQRLTEVEHRLANLAATAAQGGAVPAVLDALARHDRERQQLQLELAALDREGPPRCDLRPGDVRSQLQQFFGQWDDLLTADVPRARSLLDLVLVERIGVRYRTADDRFLLTVPVAFDRLVAAAVPALRGLQDLGEKGTSPRSHGILLCDLYRLELGAA